MTIALLPAVVNALASVAYRAAMLCVGWMALLLAFGVPADQPAAEASPASTGSIVATTEAPHDEDGLLLMTVAVGISGLAAGLLALVVVARRPALSPGPPRPATCALQPPASRAPPPFSS